MDNNIPIQDYSILDYMKKKYLYINVLKHKGKVVVNKIKKSLSEENLREKKCYEESKLFLQTRTDRQSYL